MSLIAGIIKSKMNILPIKFTVALTFLCNSNCKFCNIWKIYREEPERIIEELTFDKWKKIFDEFKNIGWIEFTGGEPTLKKDAEKIISYVYNNTDIFAGGVTTNAVLPRRSLYIIEYILNSIPENKILNVAISLDGTNDLHNYIRGVNHNFENAIWLFGALKKLKYVHKNIAVHFAYTISKDNAGNFGTFYKSLKEYSDASIEDITITFEHFSEYYGRCERDAYKSRENMVSDINKFIKILKTKRRHIDIFAMVKSAFYNYYIKNIPVYLEDTTKMVIPCVAGKYSAYIDPYGNVYPCTQWNKKLGNLKENHINNIWKNDLSNEIRNMIHKEKCPNCWTPCEAQPSWIMNFGLLRGWW